MANKRMLARSVTDDDRFSSMSSGAQALYMHLSMCADDDGFCNQVSICMFRAHASVSDFESLLDRKYIYQFESGVVVIKHWLIANAIRKDRYTPTNFKEELSKLTMDENGAYHRGDDNGCRLVATWLPQDRLGKDRLGKDSIGNGDKRVTRFTPPTLEEIKAYCRERNSPVDPQQFYEYFTAGNWKDAKGQPVKSWKQKLLTWEKYQPAKKPSQSFTSFADLTWDDDGEEDVIIDP